MTHYESDGHVAWWLPTLVQDRRRAHLRQTLRTAAKGVGLTLAIALPLLGSVLLAALRTGGA